MLMANNKTIEQLDFSRLQEDRTIEFKVSLNKDEPVKWIKSFVGFANTEGGTIYIGISDGGHPVGFNRDEIDSLQLYISDILRKRTEPIVEFELECIPIKNKLILKLTVEENQNSVVAYVERGHDICDIYVRKHGATYKASMQDLAQLFSRKNVIPFDSRLTYERYTDYSFEILSEKYKSQNSETDEFNIKKMQSLGLFNDEGFLTNAGMLFVDKREEWFPLIHMRKWTGFDKGSDTVIDRKEFRGNLIEQLNVVELFIKNNMKTGFVKLPKGRIDTESYPIRAVMEALCNAIGHCDYSIQGTQIDIDIFSDRMVITSPGDFLPVGDVSDYDIYKIPSKQRRNEIICNVFAACKLMGKSGSGFEKIYNVYSSFDEKFAPKDISEKDHFIIVLKDVLYTELVDESVNLDIESDLKLPNNQKIIYDIILSKPGLRVADLARESGLKDSSVENSIKRLRYKKLISHDGSNKHGGYYATNSELKAPNKVPNKVPKILK